MHIKCVTVGDGTVGKTCLLVSYTTGEFPYDYEATIHDRYNVSVMVNNECVSLDLWDTAGQEDYDNMRPIAYPDTDVFLLCFSVSSIASFNNARTKWHPELQRHAPNVPVVIVGTKVDQREDPVVVKALRQRGHMPVTEEAGKELAQFLGAQCYVECSATKAQGLKEVFDAAIRAAYPNKRNNPAAVSLASMPLTPPQSIGRNMNNNNNTNQSANNRPQQRQTSRYVSSRSQHQRRQTRQQNGGGGGGGQNWLVSKGKSVAKRISFGRGSKSGSSSGSGASVGYKIGNPLPGGWKTAIDSKSGEVYYYNKALATTQWYPPQGLEL